MPLKNQKRRLGWTCRGRFLPVGGRFSPVESVGKKSGGLEREENFCPSKNTLWGLSFKYPQQMATCGTRFGFVCLTLGIVPLFH